VTEEAKLYPDMTNSMNRCSNTNSLTYHINPETMTNSTPRRKFIPLNTLLVSLILGGFFLNGCVTTRKTTYLQEYEDSEIPDFYVPPEDYRIQAKDNLYLNVTTPDPAQSAMFNAMSESGTMGFDEATAQIYSYTVQQDGTVEFPYIGVVNVLGKTLNEAKALIEKELNDYVNDATLTVKLVNNSVTVLGEVVTPGKYALYKERLNIYEALAMAGDIDIYGDRYRINIIRETENGSIVKEFDITDRNIIDSEFYYVLPNDVIYVRPMKGKFFGMAEFPFALIFTGITTFILIDNYINPR
jgi:polysaccharide biosynthesis/export protein